MSQSVVARMLSPAVASSAVYLALWTSYALVTKAAIGNEGARFNKSGAIFLAELFKLVAVVLVYCLAPVYVLARHACRRCVLTLPRGAVVPPAPRLARSCARCWARPTLHPCMPFPALCT